MRLTLITLALAAGLACSGSDDTAPEEAPAEAAEEAPAAPDKAEKAEAPQPEAAEAATPSIPKDSPLLDPAAADTTAPEEYTVKLELTTGTVEIDVHRSWAPKGADRFYSLVKAGFFEDVGIFRVVPGFVVQFGLHGDPMVNRAWRNARISDDPVEHSNTKGTLTFATSGPNTRTTQLFINLSDNANLDGMGFAPFGEVKDMAPVEAITSEYGQRPNQGRITMQGNSYLKAEFPNLDYVKSATIVE